MKLWILSLLTVSTMLTACQQEQNTAASVASSPNTTGDLPVYRVASEQIYEPFVTRGEDGQQAGFELELLNAIAEKQGFRLTFSTKPWEVLFSDLQADKVDIISSGITITPERQQSIDFSKPYFETTTVLLVKGNQINHFNDMKGKMIAIQTGTLQGAIAQQYGSKDIVKSDSTWLTVKSTLSGQSVGTLGDWGSMSYYVQRYPNEHLRIIKEPNMPMEQLGFGVKKGNTEILQKLNQGLTQIKADGTYDKIRSKWFGAAN